MDGQQYKKRDSNRKTAAVRLQKQGAFLQEYQRLKNQAHLFYSMNDYLSRQFFVPESVLKSSLNL